MVTTNHTHMLQGTVIELRSPKWEAYVPTTALTGQPFATITVISITISFVNTSFPQVQTMLTYFLRTMTVTYFHQPILRLQNETREYLNTCNVHQLHSSSMWQLHKHYTQPLYIQTLYISFLVLTLFFILRMGWWLRTQRSITCSRTCSSHSSFTFFLGQYTHHL